MEGRSKARGRRVGRRGRRVTCRDIQDEKGGGKGGKRRGKIQEATRRVIDEVLMEEGRSEVMGRRKEGQWEREETLEGTKRDKQKQKRGREEWRKAKRGHGGVRKGRESKEGIVTSQRGRQGKGRQRQGKEGRARKSEIPVGESRGATQTNDMC